MLVTTPFTPDECPKCASENLTWQELGIDNKVVKCHNCGIWICPEDENQGSENLVISASVQTCPHCQEVGEIRIAGGLEWCASCGLDPNQEVYPSDEIAKLWKEGSKIREMMEDDIKALQPPTKMGTFLRSSCGPRCTFADSCPQSAANFAKCYNEYREDTLGVLVERDMGKKNHHYQQFKVSKKERKRLAREETLRKKRALFMCSAGGFFSTRLPRTKESIETKYVEDNYQE